MKIRIGTRGSALALTQTKIVAQALEQLGHECVITEIITTGDKITDKPLYDIGGKMLFLKELETALFNGEIDIAVHSLKDVPAHLPQGSRIMAMLAAEEPHEVLISPIAKSLEDLPQNAVIGSCSMRRIMQVKHLRPDLICKNIRGNVPTRLKKLYDGQYDAILLAYAGLKRLDLLNDDCHILPVDKIIPAVGQGVIAVEVLASNYEVADIVQQINDPRTWQITQLGRGFLEEIEGTCRTPMGSYALLEDDQVHAKFILAEDDLSDLRLSSKTYPANANNLYLEGRKVGLEMKEMAVKDC